MNAYDSMRLDDLRQRAQGEVLTERELARLRQLQEREREDFENEPQPQWLGGDYPDVF